MKSAGAHNGVSRAPLMPYHNQTAGDVTNLRNVRALERKTSRETHTPVAIRCQTDALIANQREREREREREGWRETHRWRERGETRERESSVQSSTLTGVLRSTSSLAVPSRSTRNRACCRGSSSPPGPLFRGLCVLKKPSSPAEGLWGGVAR